MLSIIVPTRNEAGNVLPLLERIERATEGLVSEVVFVDDSTDETPAVIRSCQGRFPFRVTLIARPPERRNGLGKAVVEGIRIAQGGWVCVMDGDLQHPPEVVPQLLDHARATGSTLVAASRFAGGGGTLGLSLGRKMVSTVLALLSRLVFPRRLRRVSDPLTGFFLVRRDLVDVNRLQPEGFKILLEILVRSPGLLVSEVPFEFAERHAGESKANSREALLLFRQMLRLHLLAQKHFLRFVGVGLSGLVVNSLFLVLLVESLGLHYLVGAVLATQGSTSWNFALTESWVYVDRKARSGVSWLRLGGFFLMNNLTLLLRGPLLAGFVGFLRMHYLVANVLSLLILMLLRFAISDRLIWRKPRGAEGDITPAFVMENP